MNRVIGIDLGTTNSAVALVQGREPRILENEDGGRTTPSVVAFNPDGTSTVGATARRQAAINPENTFYATKRLIGRKFLDGEVQRDLASSPFKIIPHSNGDAWLETSNGVKMSPLQVSSRILQKMKDVASSHLVEGEKPLKYAVVTVPAYFNDSQRQATKDAGTLIGMDVLRVVNEPTAAALAYGIDKRQKDGVVAVYDLGGGTFDISVLEIEDCVFEVRATNGNTHLGGEDFDMVLVRHILEDFRGKHGIDLLGDRQAVQRIKEAAEKCKIELTHAPETEINLPFIAPDKHISLKVSEAELDAMSLPLIDATIGPVKRCIRDADMQFSDIDQVLLVGGMTRMPKIRLVVEDLFGKKPSTAVNPDEAVALGAAIQGAVLLGQITDVVLLDVTPLTLGIETFGGIFSPLIPRNSPVPIKKEQIFSTAVDGQTGVEIRVFQGERTLVKDNKLIGNFKLSGIPLGPKGSPQIAVGFEIDADGIINVTATDKTKYEGAVETDNSMSIKVLGNTGLLEGEIAEILSESTKNKERDTQMRNYFEHASRAEIICTDTDNAVLQFGQLMEPEDKADIVALGSSIRRKIAEIRDGTELHSPQSLNEQVTEMQKQCLAAIQKVATKQRLAKE